MHMLLAFYVYVISNLVGLGKGAFEQKIVGGQHAKITDFPHSAFLAVKCDKLDEEQLEGSFSWMCGSSILNQNLLLTAAHCLAECMPNSWILVSVGHAHMYKGYRATVFSFLVHEEFDSETETNDIALVRLKNPLIFSSKVSRVVLVANPPYEEKAQLAGWGIIDEDLDVVGPYLKSIDQYVWKKWDCINLLKEYIKGTICASSDKEGHYAAGGDSGSALIVRGYIQIGIVSFKKPSINTTVIVYTDTGYFYNWIQINARFILCDL